MKYSVLEQFSEFFPIYKGGQVPGYPTQESDQGTQVSGSGTQEPGTSNLSSTDWGHFSPP